MLAKTATEMWIGFEVLLSNSFLSSDGGISGVRESELKGYVKMDRR